jgi:fructose-specific component phosphotransferase system IIB-like protein
VQIWYIFSFFGILNQEKSDNPARTPCWYLCSAIFCRAARHDVLNFARLPNDLNLVVNNCLHNDDQSKSDKGYVGNCNITSNITQMLLSDRKNALFV